jgi:4-diphosphocytidyl-2-C-methyl-D-erythritol kinase
VSGSLHSVSVRVPAKINLHLAVGAARPDGFHELHTVFQAVDLDDRVTASVGNGLHLSVGGPEDAGLGVDQSNIVWRAAELIAELADVEPNVHLRIEKNIPVAAGLAGGSADAAATLLACDVLWGLHLPSVKLEQLAARLGSDVAFALYGRTAVGTGRGEQLAPIDTAGPLHWVIAAAPGRLSTPDVYAELDRQRAAEPGLQRLGEPSMMLAALASGDLTELSNVLGNDLEPAAIALAPYLSRTLAAGHDLGALASIVSGSGPSCVFLTADRAHAVRLADGLASTDTCRFAVPVIGDVAGATVTA